MGIKTQNITIEDLINKVSNYDDNEEDLKLIRNAYEYASKKHFSQKRITGDDYISHPLNVAWILTDVKADGKAISAALLHDTIEDTYATYKDIANKFGNVVASLVLELTNNKEIKKEVGKTKYLQLKMTNMTDLALIVKLVDRLDNVKDLVNSNEEFRVKYLKETIEILNYILDNREFNEIHINIINEIKTSIFEIIEQYSYRRFIYSGNLFIVNNKIKEKSLPKNW